ncbi:MAG: YdbL family protein [Verrucomicrobium sp.]|nr:YdbL family protein [Verrucomicrobium sp.]
MKAHLLCLAPALLLCSCAPTVHVAVPKPVVIDVNMKVDVTTREEGSASKSQSQAKPAAPSGDAAAADHTRLMGEVQELKNSGLVGEGKDGYLAVRNAPQGKLPTGEDYAAYVGRIVKEENDARKAIYMQAATKQGTPLDTVQKESGERWQDAAYPGEWIQAADGSWQQKKGK